VSEVLVLRFRDLVTEPGGTIREHLKIVEARGAVWWGWWMRQYEVPPDELFRELHDTISSGTEPAAYLLDSGRALLHACRISDVRVAPAGDTIGPPDLDSAPPYYQRGAYPAWFLLSRIAEQGDAIVPKWRYASFPTNPDVAVNAALVGAEVESLDQVRNTDATLWLMDQE
jgi:hypothetical protein